MTSLFAGLDLDLLRSVVEHFCSRPGELLALQGLGQRPWLIELELLGRRQDRSAVLSELLAIAIERFGRRLVDEQRLDRNSQVAVPVDVEALREPRDGGADHEHVEISTLDPRA